MPLVITIDIPANRGALGKLVAALKDGGLADLREQFSWMAQVAVSAIEVETKEEVSCGKDKHRME